MITSEFADFAVSRRAADLDDDVYSGAARAIIDWFGATLAGAPMAPAQILNDALGTLGGGGHAQLIGLGAMTDPRTAALINGTGSHTAEFDDIFRDGIYHPGSPTVAAALATGQHLGVSGERFLRAVAVGYEIGDRIAAAMQPAHYTYWHTTGTVGAIGAAAAVAEILQLDREAFAHALGTATTMAAGLQQAFRSDAMSKPLHAGHAADSGIVAAFAAGRGYTGAPDILEGAAGFGAAMSAEPDWQAAIAKLGAPWGITIATVKNHSCCGHTFAAVDAALELRNNGVDPDQIESIEVRTYTTATKVAGNADPHTAFEAKFSTAYCVAAALRLGTVRLAAFTPESLGDPGIRDLLGRTIVTADPEFDKEFPSCRRAHVTLRMADGSVQTRQRDTRKGDPDDPLTDAEMQGKFDDLAVPVIGAEAAKSLATELWNLRGRASITELGKTDIRSSR